MGCALARRSCAWSLLFGAALLVPSASVAEEAAPAKDPAVILKLADLTEATAASKVKKLEATVKKVRGVKSVLSNRKKGEIEIGYKPDTDLAAIRKAVSAAGFNVVDPKPHLDPEDVGAPVRRKKSKAKAPAAAPAVVPASLPAATAPTPPPQR
jgi:copper chaperone CopZ